MSWYCNILTIILSLQPWTDSLWKMPRNWLTRVIGEFMGIRYGNIQNTRSVASIVTMWLWLVTGSPILLCTLRYYHCFVEALHVCLSLSYYSAVHEGCLLLSSIQMSWLPGSQHSQVLRKFLLVTMVMLHWYSTGTPLSLSGTKCVCVCVCVCIKGCGTSNTRSYLWVGVIAGLLTGCGVSRLGGDELCNIPDEVHLNMVKYSSSQVFKDFIKDSKSPMREG